MNEEELATLRELIGHYGMYAVLKEILELSKEKCEKLWEAGNEGAVLHFDTTMLLACLQRMKDTPHPGGAIMRQLDEFEPPECHAIS